MPKRTSHLPITDAIPSSISDSLTDRFKELFYDRFQHEETREIVKKIISECFENVNYMKRIKEYAGEEIDTRIYKSAGYWGKTIVIPIITTIATAFIIKIMGWF